MADCSRRARRWSCWATRGAIVSTRRRGRAGWDLCVHLGWADVIDECRLPADRHRDAVERSRSLGSGEIGAGPEASGGRQVAPVNLHPGARGHRGEAAEGARADDTLWRNFGRTTEGGGRQRVTGGIDVVAILSGLPGPAGIAGQVDHDAAGVAGRRDPIELIAPGASALSGGEAGEAVLNVLQRVAGGAGSGSVAAGIGPGVLALCLEDSEIRLRTNE